MTKEKTQEFKIEKMTPMPSRRERVKYPFDKMEVGDSFSIPDTESYIKLNSAASYYGEKYQKKFSISRLHMRLWRIK